MKWPAMTSLPCFDTMRTVLTGNISREFHALATYVRGMETVDGTVYFARAEDYLADMPTNPQIGFILLCEGPREKIRIKSNQNVGRFDDERAFRACFDTLKEEFRVEASLAAGVQQLVLMAAKNESLDRMANYIAQLYGHHVSIIDSSYTYLAHSEGIEEISADIGNDIANGRVNPEIQLMIRETDIFHPMGVRRRTTAFETIIDTPQGSRLYNNATLIYSGTAIVGSLSIFTEDEPLPRTRIVFLPVIASILALQSQHNDYWLENKGAFYTQLLTSLIASDKNQNMEEDDARMRFKAAGYDLRYYKYLVYFDMSEESYTVREAQALAMQIKQNLQNTIFYIDNGNLVFFTSAAEFIPTEDFEAAILEQVHNTGLDSTLVRVALSSCFTDIADIKSYYQQTRRAITIGRKTGRKMPVYSYDRLRLFDMFSSLPEGDDLVFLYPPLMAVIREDQKRGTQIAFTLYCYLKDPDHVQEACDELGIHKNTLYFRLNKAREIMHHDYKNGGVAMEIMLSFRLLEYHGQFRRLVIDTKTGKKAK